MWLSEISDVEIVKNQTTKLDRNITFRCNNKWDVTPKLQNISSATDAPINYCYLL